MKVQFLRRVIVSAASFLMVGAMLSVATIPAWANTGSVSAVQVSISAASPQ